MNENINKQLLNDGDNRSAHQAEHPVALPLKAQLPRFLKEVLGARIIVMWIFLVVLFYLLRFSFSVWDAGVRGVYGL